MRTIKDVLAVLHYDPKWLEYEFIDQQTLFDQLSQYESGVDENLEHYRFDAFRKALNRTDPLDEQTIHRFIELAVLDEDQTMAQAALALLIKEPRLTITQLDHLRAHKAVAAEPLQKIIRHAYLKRTLDDDQLSDDVFQQCVLSKNNEVQRKLLKTQELSLEQLAILVDRGANNAIRNLARVKLRTEIKSSRHDIA